MEKVERNLTEGPVGRQLLRFCIPFLLSNFIQAMYGFTDTLVVSWFAGPETVSGVGIAAPGATAGGLILSFFYFRTGKWRDKRLIGDPVILDETM